MKFKFNLLITFLVFLAAECHGQTFIGADRSYNNQAVSKPKTMCQYPRTAADGSIYYISVACSQATSDASTSNQNQVRPLPGQCSFPVTDSDGSIDYVYGSCTTRPTNTQCSFPVADENGNTDYVSGPCTVRPSPTQCNFPRTNPDGSITHVYAPCSQPPTSDPQCSFPITDANGSIQYIYAPCRQRPVAESQCSFPTTNANGNIVYVNGPCNNNVLKDAGITIQNLSDLISLRGTQAQANQAQATLRNSQTVSGPQAAYYTQQMYATLRSASRDERKNSLQVKKEMTLARKLAMETISALNKSYSYYNRE